MSDDEGPDDQRLIEALSGGTDGGPSSVAEEDRPRVFADEPVPDGKVRFQVVDADRTAEAAAELGVDAERADGIDRPVVVETSDGAALRDATAVDFDSIVDEERVRRETAEGVVERLHESNPELSVEHDGSAAAEMRRLQVARAHEKGVEETLDEFVFDGDAGEVTLDVEASAVDRDGGEGVDAHESNGANGR